MDRGYKKGKSIWVADVDNGVYQLKIHHHIINTDKNEVIGYILNDGTKVIGKEFLDYGRRYSGSKEEAKSEYKKIIENQVLKDRFR